MQSLTLTRFDPEPPDEPTRWQVGYAAVLDDGREVYPVTTVFAALIPDTDRTTILAAAEADILPGIEAQERPMTPPAAPSEPPGPLPLSHAHGSES